MTADEMLAAERAEHAREADRLRARDEEGRKLVLRGVVIIDRLTAERAALEAEVARLRADHARQLAAALAALTSVKAALGDRLLAKGPLSKEYAHGVMREIDEAIRAADPGAG